MLLARPIDPDKPPKLITHSRLLSDAGHRDDHRSLYWRSRRKPFTGDPSRPCCRGTCPTQVLKAQVGLGCSRQIGPSRQSTTKTGFEHQKGTGWAKAATILAM